MSPTEVFYRSLDANAEREDRETELAELVRANACGTVVVDGDALADAVRTLRDHAQGAHAQGDRARSAYQRLFDRERGLAAWDALLARLR